MPATRVEIHIPGSGGASLCRSSWRGFFIPREVFSVVQMTPRTGHKWCQNCLSKAGLTRSGDPKKPKKENIASV